MKRLFFKFALFTVAILVILIGCDKITEPEILPDSEENGDYTLIWSDEFEQESSTLNSEYWNYELGYGNGGWGNDEWQNYTNNSENIKVEDGKMVISAIWDSLNYSIPDKRDGSVTSARVTTKDKFSFKYGKIQARIKPPGDNGMWPAFWLLGSNFDTVGWPNCGEIDIMEMSPLLYNDRTTMCTVHWWDDENDNHNSYGTSKQLNTSLSDDYHVYEVTWDQQRIVGKIDNITYFVKVIDPNTMEEFFRNFFLIFNVAVGGSLGGAPDDTTDWPQSMYVDWVRVYQVESETPQVDKFGIFTDETEVDASLVIGTDAEIFIWQNEFTFEPTLVDAYIPPFEGDNVMAWSTNAQGWFGAGIATNIPYDLSTFEDGSLRFMIKIPSNVIFKIGIMDSQGNESYVTFPANQTAFGLQRDGEWGQAVIPISNFSSAVDLQMLEYEFMILEENGVQCQFAIDDIYWDKTGIIESNLQFSQNSYSIEDTEAEISITDEALPDSTVAITVENGAESITLAVTLDANGAAQKTIYFGETNEATSTIAVSEDDTIIVSYENSAGELLTDSAVIEAVANQNYVGIYSETHNEDILTYSAIINSADWSGNSAVPDEESTAVSAIEGDYVLSVNYESGSAGWGGVAFDFGSDDATGFSHLVLHVNSSELADFTNLGIKFEDNSGGMLEVNLADYTAEILGDWQRYEIPISDFVGVDFSQLKYLGLWSPTDSGGNLLFGSLYFDDIYLTNSRGID